MTMIVKICGITNTDDAMHALRVGADLIGVNLVAGPRRVDVRCAIDIITSVARAGPARAEPANVVALVPVVGGRLPHDTRAALEDAGVRRLQLYGDVTPEAVAELVRTGMEPIYVQHVSGSESLADFTAFLAACGSAPPAYVVFDAPARGRLGGTGQRADWRAIAAYTERHTRAARRPPTGAAAHPPTLLAGGLTPDNVGDAVRCVRPAGVDVSSGVESAPGVKDPFKLDAFVKAVRRAERLHDDQRR